MATGVEMLGQMSEDINLAGPVQGGNMVVKPNEAPVGAAAMLSKQLRNQANKGVAGIYELPTPQQKVPEFMQMAQEGVNEDMTRMARTVENAAPPGHIMAYITPEEAGVLKLLGGSGELNPVTGIPQYPPQTSEQAEKTFKTISGAQANKQQAKAREGRQRKEAYEQMASQGISSLSGTTTDDAAGRRAEREQRKAGFTPVSDAAQAVNKEEVVEDKETISTLSEVGDKIKELDLTDDEKTLVTQAQNALAQGNTSKAQSILNSINNEKLNSIFDSYSPKKGDDEKTAKEKKNRFSAVMGLLTGNPLAMAGEVMGGPSKEDVLAALKAGETLTLDEQNVAAGLLLADQDNPNVLTDEQLNMLKSGSGFTSQDQLDKMIKSYREGEEMGFIDSMKSFGKGGAIRPDGSISLEGLSKSLTTADKRMLKSTDPELYAKLNFANTSGGMKDLGKEQYINTKNMDKDSSEYKSAEAFNRKVMEAREISSRDKDRTGYNRPRIMEEEEEIIIDDPIVEPGDTTMPYKGPRTGGVEKQVPLQRRFKTDPTQATAQYTTTPRTQDEIYKYATEGTTGEGIGLEPFSEYQKRRRKALGLEPLGLWD